MTQNQIDKNMLVKGIITAILWISFLGVVLGAVIAAEGWGVLLAFVLMIPITRINTAIWGAAVHQDMDAVENEKRKRDRLGDILQRLSDEELHALRDGIRDGRIDDERIQDMLADDGEFIQNLR
jgi:hypothetical protein